VPKASKPGYTKKDMRGVSDNPELTKADFAKARPFSEVFPDLGGKETAAEMLMALLAHVSDQMSVIADELRTKPIVKSAANGCDVRKYSDVLRFGDEPFYDFEAYVEAELEDGSLLCWLVDVNSTPSGWEIIRAVSLVRSSSDDIINTLPEVRASTFPEFVGKVSDAMAQLVEAARSYDFRDH
jgi:hypothetical protein